MCDVHVCCRDTTSTVVAPGLKYEENDNGIKTEIRSYPNPLVCRSLNSVGRLLWEESPQALEQEPSTGVCRRSKDERSHRRNVSAAIYRRQICDLYENKDACLRRCWTHRLQWHRSSSRAVREADPGQAVSLSLQPQSPWQTQTMHFKLGA